MDTKKMPIKIGKVITFMLFVISTINLLPIFVMAQESGPSAANIQAAQDRAGQEAGSQIKARTAQEEASMRAEFENQFGAPPEAFQGHKPEKPQFESPQKVSDEVKKYLKDEEILPIYCAMTRWKTGEFFSAMNSLKKNLIPAMQKAKEAAGLDAELPNIDALISEGQSRIDYPGMGGPDITLDITLDEMGKPDPSKIRAIVDMPPGVGQAFPSVPSVEFN